MSQKNTEKTRLPHRMSPMLLPCEVKTRLQAQAVASGIDDIDARAINRTWIRIYIYIYIFMIHTYILYIYVYQFIHLTYRRLSAYPNGYVGYTCFSIVTAPVVGCWMFSPRLYSWRALRMDPQQGLICKEWPFADTEIWINRHICLRTVICVCM